MFGGVGGEDVGFLLRSQNQQVNSLVHMMPQGIPGYMVKVLNLLNLNA